MAEQQRFALSRRDFLAASALILGSGMASVGLAETSQVASVDVDALVAQHFGNKPIRWERVSISPTPLKVDSGVFVRLTVAVDHPMEPDNYIQSIAIYVEKNPSPFAVRYNFTAKSAKAEVENVIKMVSNSPIRVIAATNKGELFGVIQNAEITGGSACVG